MISLLSQLHTLPGFEFGESSVVGVFVDVAGDAGNGAGGGGLPVGPTIVVSPHIAAGAAAPRIAGVEVLAVVVGDPRRHRDTGVQQTGVTGADVNDGTKEGAGFGFDVIGPGVGPIGVAGLAGVAVEVFEVEGGVERFSVRDDVSAGDGPEMVGLGTNAVLRAVGKMICAHLQALVFAAGYVAGIVGIGVTGAFGRLGESEACAIGIDARPGDLALVMGDVDAEEAVGGVVGLRLPDTEGES